MNIKTLMAMRDEMEQIQGGIGLEPGDSKPQYIFEEPSHSAAPQIIISNDMFGGGGPSLANAAQVAMTEMAGEQNG